MDTFIFSILSVVAVTNIILGGIIFSRGLKVFSNILFGLIALTAAIWSIAIVGFYSEQFGGAINWVLFTHTAAILISSFFLAFSVNFPQKLPNRNYIISISAIVTFLLVFFIFFSDYIVGNTENNTYFIGIAYSVYAFFISIFFISGFLFLWEQLKLSNDSNQKKQIKYIFVGTLISSVLAIIPDLILPYFNIFQFTWLGPIFTLIMVVSLFLAMLKYRLFNIKVVLTEVISVLIVMALLVELLLAQTPTEILLKSVVLAIVTVFSFLLIKSVIKEVAQRENIEKLAIELQKANDRLKDLDKQKSEFVSFATHQLRAPLTAMKGYASLILEGDLGNISEEIRNAISRIFNSSETLTHIVDDYLNISRIELGTLKYTFENLDLRELVDDVIAELKPNIEKSETKLSFIVDRQKKFLVRADKDKFKQIIANIIDNSVKYTKAGIVTVKLDKIDNIKILLSIKDNGIGIAPEIMPRLFAKFSRADNANKKNIHGTGLGLFVAKEIVNAHRGRIWAESEGEGKGSIFFVELEGGE